MEITKWFWRVLLVIMLIAALGESLAFPSVNIRVKAAPQQVVLAPHLVISEFRTRGPSGVDDEFVEIYNPTGSTVLLSNWSLQKSNGCASGTDTLVTPINITLVPGQYYLFGRVNTASPPVQLYSGPKPDATFSKLIADNGGIALVDGAGNIVDAVGMCNDTAFKEGTPLADLTLNNEQSYERISAGGGNCGDTNNNLDDFSLNASFSNPQTSASTPVVCLAVSNVTSTADGVYTNTDPPTFIDIMVTFTNQVDVNTVGGTPTLSLETGVNHTNATYLSGSGTDTLTFRYTIQARDTSGDLDYVATDSLALNGATITGAMGEANLALPLPGSPGSLSANRDIVIDDGIAPSLVSIERRNPAKDSTNADGLTFRVTFSEAVEKVDTTDFLVNSNPVFTSPTTAGISKVTPVGSGDIYDVTVSDIPTSGTDLKNFNGTVGLDINPANDIVDKSKPVGKTLSSVAPSSGLDELFTVDNIVPTLTVDQVDIQPDPASATPVNFTVVFSEPIDPTTFTAGDITQDPAATSGFITWDIKDSGKHTEFSLSAVSVGKNGTIIPIIAAGKVKDLAGNDNMASTSKDNRVTFLDNVRPTVTVNQASTQADPTNTFPILFSVDFSEPINVSSFKVGDITQGGTATGVTWSIDDSGDHTKFTLSATAATVTGTIVPSIAANKITDVIGNSNVASTSTDNSVTYTTATPTPYHSVIINEIAWAGTTANDADEWIELRNTTGSPIDLTGWVLKSDDGSPTINLSGTIAANGLLLLVRNTGTFKEDISSPVLFYGNMGTNQSLLNSGEILRLRNKNSVDVDVANSYSGYGFSKWAAGTSTPNRASMERGAYLFSNPTEWVTYNGTPTIHDRSDNLVYGTPGKTNWINATALSITTIVSDTPDPSLVNQSVTVTVTVVGGVNTPSGTVTITGANTNCSVTLSNGIGSCSVSFSSVGSKTLTATYGGDATHPTSSDTEPHQVSTSTTINKTPTPIATAVPPPQLLAINEFVPRPGHDWNNDGVVNTGDEYIEVLNHGVVNVNLSGYSLDDEVNVGSDPYRLPSLTLRPGERYVFYGSETGILLGDGGDAVRLQKPNGQLADAYNYTVVERPDQSFCRLPDNGGADDWNTNCYPTPGLQNSQDEGDKTASSNTTKELYCPIADTLPQVFVQAECQPFGNNIWRPEFWDQTGWYGDQALPGINTKWPVFAN